MAKAKEKKLFIKGWEWYQSTIRPSQEEVDDLIAGAMEAGYVKPKEAVKQLPGLKQAFELEGEALEFRQRRESGQLAGLSCGYASVDKLLQGLVPGEVTVISGKTSHGKSQLAVNIAYRVAHKQDIPVLYISLEQTKVEVVDRLMSLQKSRTGNDSLGMLPVMLQDKPDLTPEEVEPLIAYAAADGIGLVIIDHLHMWIRGEEATGKAAMISQAIKQSALKHEVPILALAQLRKTNGRYPDIDDLKDSVVLGQDADIVLLVHRPKMDDPDGAGEDNLTVNICKNRNRGFNPMKSLATLKVEGVVLKDFKNPVLGSIS